MLKQLAIFVTFLAAATAAQARVHSVSALQDITQHDADGYPLYSDVGIDGDSIILATKLANGTRTTLLRRGAGGRWAESRVLSTAVLPDDQIATDVSMKNGVAAVRISTHRILIFERVNNNWLQTDALDDPDYTGGLAISGARVLLGAVGCTEGTNAFVFEKNAATGRWVVAGRIDQGTTSCDAAVDLDLNNTTAMIHQPDTRNVQVFRRNGSALNWLQSDSFQVPDSDRGSSPLYGAMAVQGNVAVAPGSSYFRVTSSGYWTLAGRIVPADFWTGTGNAGQPVFRDGILINSDLQDGYRTFSQLYAYVPNAAGGFDHVAILHTYWAPYDYDVSGRTVVVASAENYTTFTPSTEIFSLPDPLVSAEAIAQDFETRDVSGFTQAGNAGFALTGAGTGYVLRSAAGGDAIAVVNGSNWRGYEYVEADVAPISVASGDPYVGLAVRYTDTNNYYIASIRGSNRLRIDRKVAGAVFTIREMTFPFRLNATRHFSFSVNGKTLTAVVSGAEGRAELTAEDTTFGAGSVALLTSRARADFDNVFTRPTAPITLADKAYDEYDIYGRPWAFSGGTWIETWLDALKQTNTTGSASAIVGIPVGDQHLSVTLRLDSFGSSNPVSSFSLLARYVDTRTYYSLSVRSTGQMQIRKTVAGVTTVLKAVSFTPGVAYRHYELRVVGRELHAYVDDALLLAANAGDIAAGTYGLATYRAAISSRSFYVSQP